MRALLLVSVSLGLVCAAAAMPALGRTCKEWPAEEQDTGLDAFWGAVNMTHGVAYEDMKGKVLLFVNVASYCGYTDHNYQQLNEMVDTFHGEAFRILAFPCNQFGAQEPHSDEELLANLWRDRRIAPAFDLLHKVEVNGPMTVPVYEALKAACPQRHGRGGNVAKCGDLSWNFEKFLVDAEGMPFARYSTVVDPVAITEDIRTLLKQEKDRVARLAARAQAQASDAAAGRIAHGEL